MRTLLFIVIAAALAAPAQAAPRFVRLQDGPPIVTDGKRFAVELQPERVLVTDTRTGTRRTIQSPEPGLCGDPVAGGGHLLWDCSRPGYQSSPRMFTLAAGTEVEVGGRATYERLGDASGTNGVGLHRVVLGATWLRGVAEPCYHCEQYVFLNWRTGETVEALGGARDVEDLDSARGYRRACRPVRRRWQHEGDDWSGYTPPWSRLVTSGRWTLGSRGLQRCGSRRVTRVGRESHLTGDHAVWLDGRTVVVRDLRNGRRYERRLAMRYAFQASVAVTRNRAYVIERGSDTGRRWRIDLR